MEKKFYENNKLMNNKSSSSIKVKQFYQQVIEDFGKRLIIRFDGKEQGIDSEIIDQLKKKLREQIHGQTTHLFNAALETTHYSSTSLARTGSKIHRPHGQIIKQQENLENPDYDQQHDYLDLFNVDADREAPIDEEDIVKKEEISPEQPVKVEDGVAMQHNDDRDDEEDRQKQKQTENLKKNLTMHIVGTYQPKSKKHIAKDQSTKLQLDDVFIQYKQDRDEQYYHKLICQFKKD